MKTQVILESQMPGACAERLIVAVRRFVTDGTREGVGGRGSCS